MLSFLARFYIIIKQVGLLLFQVFLSLNLLKPYTDFHKIFVIFITFQTTPISYFSNFLEFVISWKA
jgi:hypothetical protein